MANPVTLPPKNDLLNGEKLSRWMQSAKKRGKPSEYSFKSPQLLESDYHKAKAMLERINNAANIRVDDQTFYKALGMVNLVVSNTLPEEIFRFKVGNLYTIFQDYPSTLFDQELVNSLATCSRFFPSANEIRIVLDAAKERLDTNVARLRQLVDQGFYSPEAELRQQQIREEKKIEEQRQREEKKAAFERVRLREATNPIDKLVEDVRKAVERYLPKDGSSYQLQGLVTFFQEKMDVLSDVELKAILKNRIDQIRNAERQMEELHRIGMMERKVA